MGGDLACVRVCVYRVQRHMQEPEEVAFLLMPGDAAPCPYQMVSGAGAISESKIFSSKGGI